MQIGIDIMTQEQFVLDFNKKTAFIRSCFCLFDLDIEIPHASIQYPIYAKASITILFNITQVIPIHHLNIPRSKNFLFQPDSVDFMLSAYLIDTGITSLSVENNTNKPIYISQNFCLNQIQELTYSNIEQLYTQEAVLAKQISYNQYKKAWLKRVISIYYAVYKE